MKNFITFVVGMLMANFTLADTKIKLNVSSTFDYKSVADGSLTPINQSILAQLLLVKTEKMHSNTILPVTAGFEDVRITAPIEPLPTLSINADKTISFGGVTVPAQIYRTNSGAVSQILVDNSISWEKLGFLLRPQIQQAIKHTGLIANLPSDRMPKIVGASAFFCLQQGNSEIALRCSISLEIEGQLTRVQGEF